MSKPKDPKDDAIKKLKNDVSKMGRPPKEIDEKQFSKLCMIFCTEEEIASFFDCSVDTLNRWCKKNFGGTFAEVYSKKSAGGRTSIRRKQYQVAVKGGNIAMLIWLGKQYLNQKEKVEQTNFDGDIEVVFGDDDEGKGKVPRTDSSSSKD